MYIPVANKPGCKQLALCLSDVHHASYLSKISTLFNYFAHLHLPLNVITNCVGLSWCNVCQCIYSLPGLSHLNCVERPATATLVQGVLTPFDRLEGYERKVQTGTEAAGASEKGPVPQPTPGAFQTFLPLWLTLLPCTLLPLSSVHMPSRLASQVHTHKPY